MAIRIWTAVLQLTSAVLWTTAAVGFLHLSHTAASVAAGLASLCAVAGLIWTLIKIKHAHMGKVETETLINNYLPTSSRFLFDRLTTLVVVIALLVCGFSLLETQAVPGSTVVVLTGKLEAGWEKLLFVQVLAATFLKMFATGCMLIDIKRHVKD